MKQHIARLVYSDGKVEDRFFSSQQRDRIVLCGFDQRRGIFDMVLEFDRGASDRDAIPTFTEKDESPLSPPTDTR